jgi:cytoskeletal protein CcmA (bactofilin family)
MIAQRVIYYFRDLLDIKATRAASAWLRLNTDGTVSERTAAQTVGDLGAASLTGANTFTSTSNSFTQPLYLNSAIIGTVTSPIAGAYNGNGAGLTGDAQNLIVGYATLAGVAYSFAGTLPITSGGTGGDTPGAARTGLKLDDATSSLSLASLTTSASTYADGATFTYSNAAAITNHRNALGLGTGGSVVFGNITSNQIQIGVEARTIGTTSGSGLIVRTTGGPAGEFSYGGCYLRAPFRIRNSSDLESRLETDDSNKLAQRNGTNAQTSRIYDTYSSATDYHRLALATARATATGMSGATITLTNIIPAGAVVVGVTCKVVTAITGATSFDIGTAADVDRFGAAIGASAGTTSDNRNWTSGTVECFPANTSLILTANGGNFAAGAVYVSVQYLSGQAD